MVIGSYAPALVTFRGDLLSEMVKSGNNVIAIAPEHDESVATALRDRGVTFKTVPMARATISPFLDMKTLAHLVSLMRRERPDTLLTYNMKPIVYGGIGGRIAEVPNRYAMIAGLGYIFSDDEEVSRTKRWLRHLATWLYRVAMRGAKAVIVFNPDDAAEVSQRGMLAPGQKLVQVAGSGIELTRFPQVPVPSGPTVFLLIARLLRQKGLFEYVAAARKIKARFPEARIQLLGPLDPSPNGVSQSELDGWIKEGAIEYLGETRDVRPFLANSSVYVLPSFYREGIPRTVIEALATGRAIITTDSPGCRETVVAGENGFLVPPRDADALALAMEQFLRDPSLAVRMGERSRRLAVERFDVNVVNAALLTTMGLR
jgi:glycosyltransferase involved in cell wall biosynthesis